MAERFLFNRYTLKEEAPLNESTKKKRERDVKLAKLRKIAITGRAKRYSKLRHQLKLRTYKNDSLYKKLEKNVIDARRKAKKEGGFYVEPQPKVLFAIRLKGINKLAPKPKMILRLFRLLQIHNGVFIKVNKATREMLKAVEPFITFGYPSLSSIRQLIYKRGYAKVGVKGAHQRKRIQTNDVIAKNLGRYGIFGIEDLVKELYTCGEHFKEASNFLWPFKLNPPRGGFKCKRHGFGESRGGDWGDRGLMINQLVKRMN